MYVKTVTYCGAGTDDCFGAVALHFFLVKIVDISVMLVAPCLGTLG